MLKSHKRSVRTAGNAEHWGNKTLWVYWQGDPREPTAPTVGKAAVENRDETKSTRRINQAGPGSRNQSTGVHRRNGKAIVFGWRVRLTKVYVLLLRRIDTAMTSLLLRQNL